MTRFGYLVLCSLAVLAAAGRGAAAQDEYAAVRDKLETCFTCHGPNGTSTQPEIPILAGQEQYYLYVQLKDFAAGRRADPIMSEIAKGLEKEQMLSIAKFFSEQAWPHIAFEADPAAARTGLRATAAGECQACHLSDYMGNSRVPRLAGQRFEYLKKTMTDLKTNARGNATAIAALMQSYSDDDIAAMAEFLAGL